MAESMAYRDIRRKLLSKNPYFQQDLAETRRRLGLPEKGFDQAVQELSQGIPVHPTGVFQGQPDLRGLKAKARQLGLPLEEVLTALETGLLRQGRDFQREVEEVGWGALPIRGDAMLKWWLAQERQQAGLPPLVAALPAGSPPDPRIPSQRAALWLARRYRLGDDYAFQVGSILLGCAPGGGEADVEMEHRLDGAGLRVTLPCVRYDCTLAEWEQIFRDSVQPQLFRYAGKLSSAAPYGEAIKTARRRARPGRPPYTPETLEMHRRMWEFWHQNSGFQQGKGSAALDAFLSSLLKEQRHQYDDLDLETFRRAAKGVDRQLRPTTGSEPDFLS